MRIGNCSGFYGDRFSAMREMLEGGELDVLTGDYLAELTMLLLYRSQAKDPAKGYATTFVKQLADCLPLATERGVRIVANASGLRPAPCAVAVRDLAQRIGLDVKVAHVEGDDVRSLLPPPAPLTANAYLGGWGIAAALEAGADVVVTGRVTDAALVIGPAAWWHGWARDDWDALGGALVTGHILECGAQATGGNYPFPDEVSGLEHVGFPLAEIQADGTAVIAKHPGTGGRVSVGTVTAQLLYEITGRWYDNPDVTADFASIELSEDGPDRVRVSGVRGRPPPPTAKVALNLVGGFRNTMTFLLTGLDIEAKAGLVRSQLAPALDGVDDVEWTLLRADHADPARNEDAVALLRVTVKDATATRVGRAFANTAVECALASYAGCTLLTPPADATPYGVYQATTIPAEQVEHIVALHDGRRISIEPAPTGPAPPVLPDPVSAPEPIAGPRERVPLGTVYGARSGDKGADATLGVWAPSAAAWPWLRDELTTDRLRALLPEAGPLAVDRFELPNLRAVGFVLRGLLGEGVAASSRLDPQAKGLGEWLRARLVDLPKDVL